MGRGRRGPSRRGGARLLPAIPARTTAKRRCVVGPGDDQPLDARPKAHSQPGRAQGALTYQDPRAADLGVRCLAPRAGDPAGALAGAAGGWARVSEAAFEM